MDLYSILQITKESNPTEIKASYRKLAIKYHPDITKGDGEEFMKINFAYGILSDRYKRNFYDLFGEMALEQFKDERKAFLFSRLFSPLNVNLISLSFFILIIGISILPYFAVYSIINMSFPTCSFSTIPFLIFIIIILIVILRTFFKLKNRADFQKEMAAGISSCFLLLLISMQFMLIALTVDGKVSSSKYFTNIPYLIIEVLWMVQIFVSYLSSYSTIYEFILCICNACVRFFIYNILIWDFHVKIKIGVHLYYLLYLLLTKQLSLNVYLTLSSVALFYNITFYLIFTGYVNIYAFITHFIFVGTLFLLFCLFQFQYYGIFRMKRKVVRFALPRGA
ncbi:DNAJ protein [Spraguea lophii 42_110]|uniref:DNAJ protein n=1 Tax=Spraguea lophii (strain 42_110) TaxID=1358809 RepID=S7W9S5_SPRLO|nr:DNAJ protein [Spraguea lophii 42_110]